MSHFHGILYGVALTGLQRLSVLQQGSLRNQRTIQAFCDNEFVKRAAHFGSSKHATPLAHGLALMLSLQARSHSTARSCMLVTVTT